MKYTYILLLLLFFSCAKPLQGTYTEEIVWRESNLTYDQAFDKAIETFVTIGSELQRVDRPNGFIQFEGYIPYHRITTEYNGKPKNPQSFVVVSSSVTKFNTVMGLFTVLVRPKGEKSLIGVRLTTSIRLEKKPPLKYYSSSLGYYETNLLDAITR